MENGGLIQGLNMDPIVHVDHLLNTWFMVRPTIIVYPIATEDYEWYISK